jgi:uncharacterized cupin superfamily protein
MPDEPITRVRAGDGWAVAHLDDLGEGWGFRKVRAPLGVTAFGVNAIVLPPGYSSKRHYHERQQELYLVLEGEVEIEFGDGERHALRSGGLARVDPGTVRCLHNASPTEEAMYFCVGGADGYVGRDGQAVEE